ncbi:MAG: hypothetical protein M3542_06860 [Acidobacteriota bacterium]|nr:hypothetical protein [Acidobacteriota bacterium]MDQ5870985.1 hypothetical protein [Acidobacteriota bacterium]
MTGTRHPTRRGILSVIGVAVGVIAVLVLSRRPSEDLPSSAVRDWSRIASGRLHLDMRSSSPSAVSGFFVEQEFPFRVEPTTIALPGYQLVGARVHALGGRPTALAVHRDARNKIVVCQRFEGRVEELPRPDRIFVRDALKVHLYRSRGANAVFWQDGAVARSLASDVPETELLRLALSGKSSVVP